MVRAPCCEKMGLKRGPWTAEEDQVLINFISLYGHGNWRALPKQAGLLRCGKSCRLRWTNYLRPDIKRGNFTREEEDAIINLHQMLGNRWSTIAARLPGRTDNEIKNVWHTHLKKRLLLLNKDHQQPILTKEDMFEKPKPQPVTISNTTTSRGDDSASTCSPPQSSSSTDDMISSSSSSNNVVDNVVNVSATSLDSSNDDEFLKIDESLIWSDVLPALPLSACLGYGGDHNEMEFWYEMFNRSGDMFVPEML